MFSVNTFENRLIEAYLEYFDSESSQDFFADLPSEKVKDRVAFERRIIICGIHLAVEGKSRERELFSKLLVDGCLTLRCISRVRVESAFNTLLDHIHEIFLDNPFEGAEAFANLIARAIADEVLLPDFILSSKHFNKATDKTLESNSGEKSANAILKMAWAKLQAPHGMVKIDYIWENYSLYSGNKSAATIEKKLRMCVHEFIDSHDFKEVKREIKDMGADDLNFEWVYQILLAYLEERSQSIRAASHIENSKWLLCLLQILLSEGYLTLSNLKSALRKVKADVLFLDFPNFKESFEEFSKSIRIQ